VRCWCRSFAVSFVMTVRTFYVMCSTYVFFQVLIWNKINPMHMEQLDSFPMPLFLYFLGY
jgi:hypothetical protein